jgi:hypothetical protein
MIQMPRRSVTRFFIPLIDVLTLLFCIFLLMPLVKAPAESSDEKRPADGDGTAQDSRERNDTLEKLRAENDQLRRDKSQVLQRLVVRVLEIDPANGQLFYYNPQRVEVRSEADAHDLILHDRQTIGESGRELYYEILFPRDPNSPFPLLKQREKYDEWFKEVAHGWDVPSEPLKGVKP